LVLQVSNSLAKLDSMTEFQKKKTWRESLDAQFDTLSLENNFSLSQRTIIKETLFNSTVLDSTELDTILSQNTHDTISNKKSTPLVTTSAGNSFSINSSDMEEDSLGMLLTEFGEFLDLEMSGNGSKLKTEDFLVLSEDAFKKKHTSGNKLKDAYLTQVHKLFNNPSSSIQFILGNGTWAILILILLMALVFKLLYIRRNFLFAEHFLFHIYGHTRILLLLILFLLIYRFLGISLPWLNIIPLIGIIYLYLGMKSFYNQSRVKTFLKMSLTVMFYSTAILLCNILILGISFLVF